MKYSLIFLAFISFCSFSQDDFECGEGARNLEDRSVYVEKIIVRHDWDYNPHMLVTEYKTNKNLCVAVSNKQFLNLVYESLIKKDSIIISTNEFYTLTSILKID